MSGVNPNDPVVLHQFRPREGSLLSSLPAEVLCGGVWYEIGASPCEIAEKNFAAINKELPPCEASDEDIVAAAALLGIPRASRCWNKSQASWDQRNAVNAA